MAQAGEAGRGRSRFAPGTEETSEGDARAGQLVSSAVRRAQAGDREAFAFLYARFADDVCGYVRGIVGDEHEAQDVTQQVFAKLMRVIGKYREREGPFFAWLLRVARNLAVDHLRRQRPIPVEEVRASQLDCGQSWASPGLRRIDDLKEALATLPKDQREVLVLRHISGLSPGEIATLTGRSEGSIHGLHHRGRQALRAALLERDAAPVTARL
jgi:RNA polymerase sigma-70 factor, ECF subfamily